MTVEVITRGREKTVTRSKIDVWDSMTERPGIACGETSRLI